LHLADTTLLLRTTFILRNKLVHSGSTLSFKKVKKTTETIVSY